MAFIDNLLQEPAYGWSDKEGELVVPSARQLFREFCLRINIISTRKNWISLTSLLLIGCLLSFLYIYLVYYFSWSITIVMLLYSMFVMSIHATVWLHRYCTHRAFRFSHNAWRYIIQNLVIKTVPEEIYVLSHLVHHAKSDQPGDPYNARGGFWYCMLAEFNHQRISKDLSPDDYRRAVSLLRHTGIRVNNYQQYRKWGSVASPFYTIALWIINWSCWYTLFYFTGGHGLATAMFSAALFWFIMVRAFNYTGHGKGHQKHRDGIDFDRSNLSINQVKPGLLAGEWHNNHHLYPASARTGFLPYQIDLPWVFIFSMYKLGIISVYHDSKKDFLQKYSGNEFASYRGRIKAKEWMPIQPD